MAALRKGITKAGGLALLVLLQACATPPAAPPARSKAEASDPAAAAAYAGQVNVIANRFEGVIDRSGAYDELAYGVRDRKISATRAREDARKLSAELRAEFDRLSDQLERKAEVPDSLGNYDQRDGLRNVVAMADNYRESARVYVESGEALVTSAVAGEFAELTPIKVRRLRFLDAQLAQQVVLIEAQLAKEDGRGAPYHLTAAARSQVNALRGLLGAGLAAYGTGDPSAVAEQKEAAERWIRLGLESVETGRELLPGNLRDARSPETEAQIGAGYQRVMIDLFETSYPQSFDAEERILRKMKDSLDRISVPRDDRRDAFVGELAVLVDRINDLARERSRLGIERQQRVASP